MANRAPIALFVYNRPEHTRRTIEALARNEGALDSDLYVFSDGPRNGPAMDGVMKVRDLVRRATGFRTVEVIERGRNLGLAGSIIDGVSLLCSQFGKVVVVEDDLVTSRWFLKYLNDGLERFRDDERVASVHAYLPPLGRPPQGNFFLYGADCWGWATWQRAWKDFIPDGELLLARLKSHAQRRFFDYIGPLPHTSMLKGYQAGKNDSWAIRWHASMFLEGRLTLHPKRTLVTNIGLDGSGTHCSDNDDMNSKIQEEPLAVDRVPLVHSEEQWAQYRRRYISQLLRRAIRKVWR